MSFTETDPPFKFRNVSGTMLNLGDSIFMDTDSFRSAEIDGPRATAALVWGSDLPVRYYVHVVGDSSRSAMSRVVYPTLPTTGGGKLDLDIRSQRNPHFLDYILTNMDVRTTGSRLMGQMTFGTGGPVLAVKKCRPRGDAGGFRSAAHSQRQEVSVRLAGKDHWAREGAGGPLTHFEVQRSSLIFETRTFPEP